MNVGAVISLIPALIGTGKATEALDDYHVISTVAIPLFQDPEVFTTWSKASAVLAAASKDGRLTKVNEALFSLGKIGIALLSDPSHAPAVMTLLNSFAPTSK